MRREIMAIAHRWRRWQSGSEGSVKNNAWRHAGLAHKMALAA
jgi:hypothetical protein